MKRGHFQLGVVGLVIIAGLLAILPLAPRALAQGTELPELRFTRFKVASGSQYFEVRNIGGASADMSKVQLVYYNDYDLSQATSSKLVSLAGSLEPGEYYLINDSSLTLCYQVTVASSSLSFSTTAGMVQLVYFDQKEIGGPFTSSVLDSVAWSKKEAAGSPDVQTLPSTTPASFLQKDVDGWNEYWPSQENACLYESAADPGLPEPPDESYVFLQSTMPPVRYVAAVSEKSGKINRNIGKMAPVVNELLPNPASPQTDAADEFIELYNPNDSSFDLTDFKLAFGSTNPKRYTFPEGTVLPPKSFVAFTSGDTSISLSNSSAQVWLLDPDEKVISQSEPYASAKDGQAWALDNGTWVWTLQPSPHQINTLTGIPSFDDKAKTTAAVLGISSTKDSPQGGAAASSSNASKLDDAAPLHPAVLAGVGLLAVGYALYEYRHDMANRIFQFRRYLRNRRTLRQEV